MSSERTRPASIVLPRPTSSQSKARPRNRRRTVLTVRIWWSRSSISFTSGSAISRSNPACVASPAALSARSNSRRPVCGPAPPAITPQSWESRTIGIPCSVITVPLAGAGARRSATSRSRPGVWYSSQSEAPTSESTRFSPGTITRWSAGWNVISRGCPSGASSRSSAKLPGPNTRGSLKRSPAPSPSRTTSNRSPGSSPDADVSVSALERGGELIGGRRTRSFRLAA